MSEDEGNTEVEGAAVSSRLFSVIVLGICLVFVGVAVMVVASALSGDSRSVGGVILIGSIPIVFGAGPDAAWLIALSVVLTIISLVLFLVFNRRVKENRVGLFTLRRSLLLCRSMHIGKSMLMQRRLSPSGRTEEI